MRWPKIHRFDEMMETKISGDRQTIDTYSAAAADFATDWLSQPEPTDMYRLLQRFFIPGGKTADIGCGAGRDLAWLNENGFPAVGYDASEGLVEQAAARFPGLTFKVAALPELAGIEDASFENVLCETVIMHLPPDQVGAACRRLFAILKDGGILYLSWRLPEGDNSRDKSGRLYSSFDAGLVTDNLPNAGLLLNEEAINESSGRRVHRIVAKRG